ncbi:hypothetical protein KK083_03785 [Fulvivirgaceae bacterium PWU4]|uniref:Multidrug resistance protein MdtA-like C-terminal permuted SH3 domain-containing protein n=1 Tax=Chryseosolibacter histidini TaxID=2782349 RepID=A0AAP2DIG7_9BACT|nr:hypothetical protein [Chryseosolibacter histidini]MBT1695983.1 hypothetical protein [Chryseosolibacter histidini]
MRILVVLPVALILLFVVYNVFFAPRRPVCGLGRAPILSIATVHYGNFQELIPATGTVILDSVSNTASVKVPIDELYFSRIVPGLKASTTINNQDYVLTLISLDSVVTEGRFNTILRFDGEVLPSLKPDQSLRIRLSLSPARDAIQLPVGGFYKDTGGSYVYVVKNDLAIKRNVVLGRKNMDCFEVLSGLSPGEEVITSSYEKFDKEDILELSEIKALYE